ncbi:DNAJ protein [Hibiscus syriacus]|uniref:DNAJ protein n=2 Tax=Hibiscus syriacus TaxID=106335 RepID=A0A6A2X8Y3_HIBSY|nr:DNAJ protein [Hibiscus syriacus]
MLPEILYNKFRVGSQFFVLAKQHAFLVLKERKFWRKFKLPCLDLDSCYPEEHYFPTLLSMEDPTGSSHYTLTRVNWTDSVDGHPHTYNSSEISPELVHTLRKSNSSSNYSYYFAQKFSPDCLKPLMEIANDIFRD